MPRKPLHALSDSELQQALEYWKELVLRSSQDRQRFPGPAWESVFDGLEAAYYSYITELDRRMRAGYQQTFPFTLIVVDRDANAFSVEGPMHDDRPWNTAVIEAQKEGRSVVCHTPGGIARSDVEAAAAAYSQEYGYQRVAPGSIIRPK
jgi:hypothetical protein